MEEEEVKGLADYLGIIRRRINIIIISALTLLVVSAIVVYTLPATYKSEGLILIESQEIPNDLVRTTVTSYADQRIAVIKQRIMTTSNVMEMVEKYGLYPKLTEKRLPASEYVSSFKENIMVEMLEANVTDPRSGRNGLASIAFTVAFMDESPELAQKVSNELVSEFLNENIRARTVRATETKDFLEEEGNKFERKVQLLDKKIAEFKDENSDTLPELLPFNKEAVTRLKQELLYYKNQTVTLQDQILTMNLELVNIPIYVRPYSDGYNRVGASGQQPYTVAEQLFQVKALYSTLSAKYSKNHPDVLQLERQIASLEGDLGSETVDADRITSELALATADLSELKQRYSALHPDVKTRSKQVDELEQQLSKIESKLESTKPKPVVQKKQLMNPVYLQIQSKIDSSEREIKRIQSRQVEVKAQLADFEQRIIQTYQVTRAFNDLTRDYANQLGKYRELRAKQLQAQLSQNLEFANKGETFTLIEPPQIPDKAEKPDRPKLLVLAVILSIGAGLGLGFLVELLFGGLRGYTQITRVLGTAPLVVIPNITTVQDIYERSVRRRRFVFLFFILLVSLVACFHVLVMDLEVLWFKLIQKISLL